MLDSLYIATSGLNAQQLQIDTISNNIANVNTVGYKKSKMDFSDLLYKEMSAASITDTSSKAAQYIGTGVSASSNQKVFTDGNLIKTNGVLDVAINGKGFFEVTLPDNTSAYTRAGSFKLDNDGFITDKDGNKLSSMVQLPPDFEGVFISPTGDVSVKLPGDERLVNVGNIEMVSFISTDSLQAKGNSLYVATKDSGDAMTGIPGEIGLGTISQGFLESSNVEYVFELTDLVLAQRGYEMNSKMIQVSDQIMGIINNLYRS